MTSLTQRETLLKLICSLISFNSQYCNYIIVYLSACLLGCELLMDPGCSLFTFIPGPLATTQDMWLRSSVNIFNCVTWDAEASVKFAASSHLLTSEFVHLIIFSFNPPGTILVLLQKCLGFRASYNWGITWKMIFLKSVSEKSSPLARILY